VTDTAKGTAHMKARLTTAAWRKSSHSGNAGNCVEVAGGLPGAVGVRDSKDPDGQALVFTTPAWRAFADRVKSARLRQQLARYQPT
jgi:Domain of unknown function (DUF397)